MERELLEEFIEWAKNCGEDVFFVFDNPEEAIDRFLVERYYGKD